MFKFTKTTQNIVCGACNCPKSSEYQCGIMYRQS